MSTQAIPMYQGETFSQQLTYFTDTAQLVPLVFTEPVMDLRDADANLLARFDESGLGGGLLSIAGPDHWKLVLANWGSNQALLTAATQASTDAAGIG